MSIKDIERDIALIEKQISSNFGDLEYLKNKLNKLKLQAFEEDIRESGEQQLLKG
jgi:hypothetical protein